MWTDIKWMDEWIGLLFSLFLSILFMLFMSCLAFYYLCYCYHINVYHALLWKGLWSAVLLYHPFSGNTVTYNVFSVFHCENSSIFNPQSMLYWGTLSLPLSSSSLFLFPSQEDCQPCLPGYYCDALGLSAPSGECWEGFFCLQGADRPDPPLRDSRGGPCPKGDQISQNLSVIFQWNEREICPKKMHENNQ